MVQFCRRALGHGGRWGIVCRTGDRLRRQDSIESCRDAISCPIGSKTNDELGLHPAEKICQVANTWNVGFRAEEDAVGRGLRGHALCSSEKIFFTNCSFPDHRSVRFAEPLPLYVPVLDDVDVPSSLRGRNSWEIPTTYRAGLCCGQYEQSFTYSAWLQCSCGPISTLKSFILFSRTRTSLSEGPGDCQGGEQKAERSKTHSTPP